MQPQRRSEPGRSALQRRGVLPRPTGFLAPERLRADLRLALRGILGLMVPVLLGRALDLPAFDMVGIAAFLLTFGDVTGSEEPRQIIRLAVATVLGATALASGVIAGSHALGATAGMFVWGAAAGLLGAYGNAGAAMGLPVTWSYLELGLTAPVHTLSHAFALAALYAGGGLWAVILASVINVIGPYGPVRERTAQCYAVLATYLERALCAHSERLALEVPSPETRVRLAIASARLLAARTRQRQQAMSEVGQRLMALVELADHLFSLSAALRDSLVLSAPDQSDAVLIEAVHSIPAAIAGRAKADAGRLSQRLEDVVGREPYDDASGLRGQIAGVVLTALQLATGEVVVPAVADAQNLHDPSSLLEPLRACLTWDSVVLRHALRFGVLVAAAVALQRVWNPPFGYWIPLTVTVVLKPYAGTTWTRAAQRLTGTVAGVAVGLVISAMISGWAGRAVATAAAFSLLLAVLPINYGWAVFFLSAGIIPYEDMLTGSVDWQTGLFRILNTGVGGVLALVGGRLLWLPSEIGTLQPTTAATIRAMARYAACIIGASKVDDDLEQAHRRAGLMNSNLQACFQRTMREVAPAPDRFQAYLLLVTTLQNLLLSLNTLRTVGVRPELTSAEGKRFADEVVLDLEHLGDALGAGRRPASLNSAALYAVSRAMARDGDGTSLRRIVITRIGQQVLALYAAAERLVAERPPVDQRVNGPG